MADRRVLIEHKDGRRFSVTLATFNKVYEPQGFKVDRYEDGTEYVAPKRATATTGADKGKDD